jgi:hypothetical protein
LFRNSLPVQRSILFRQIPLFGNNLHVQSFCSGTAFLFRHPSCSDRPPAQAKHSCSDTALLFRHSSLSSFPCSETALVFTVHIVHCLEAALLFRHSSLFRFPC